MKKRIWLNINVSLPFQFLLLLLFLISSVAFAQSKAITLYGEAIEAEERGNNELATELYKAALRENSQYREPYLRLAELRFRSDAPEEALLYAETALKMDRTNASIQILRARILTSLGRFDEAATVFDLLLKKEPYNTDLYRAMGELEIARGSLRGALLWYERALAVDPLNRTALLSSATVQDALDLEEPSERAIVKALELYPESFDVHMTAARHYIRREEWEKAAYHCDIAMRISPDSREALLLYADLLALQGNYTELLQRINKSPSSILLPDDYLSFYIQGAAYMKTGNPDGAVKAFEAVLRIKPEDEISRISYEHLLTNLDEEKRLQYADSIDRVLRYHLDLADNLLERNRLQESMDHVRRALQIDPDSISARTLYAKLWLLKGFPDKQLSILEVISDKEKVGTEIHDLIEIYRHELSASVSRRWKLDQFDHDRFRYRIPVYISAPESSMIHSLSNDALATFCSHIMHGNEHLFVPDSGEVLSFASAYGRARNSDAHYFAILSFTEDERSFTLTSELYSGVTGALIKREQFYRTGNERISSAVGIWADRVAESLPHLGRVVKYTFSSALIDLGRIDGIEADDELIIIPRNMLQLSRGSLALLFDPDKKAGTITISETDELVSEGVVEAAGFYDLITPGDWVVYTKKEEHSQGEGEGERKGETERRIPQEGPRYSDIYQMLLGIR